MLGIKDEDMQEIANIIGKSKEALKELNYIYLITKAFYKAHEDELYPFLMEVIQEEKQKKEVKDNE